MRTIGALFAAVLLSAAGSVTVSPAAFAQAGSAGGTLGKTDKSLSGGNNTPPPQHPSNAAPKQQRTVQPAAAQSCDKFVGTWSWIAGHTIIFKPGGVMKSLPEGTAGTWSCQGSTVQVVWDNGFIDRDSMSADGTQISGTNQFGSALSGTRQ